MVSEKQLIANRENGKRGGPKTDQGKKTSRLNALTHGLLAKKEVLLQDEDGKAFTALHKGLVDCLHPEGQLETTLVEVITMDIWRLRRVWLFESRYFNCHIDDTLMDLAKDRPDLITDIEAVYTRTATDVFSNRNTLSNIHRYETSIYRQLTSAMHELERLQLARRGEMPPVPVAVDINLSHADYGHDTG